MVEILPSILASDFAHLGDQVAQLEAAGCAMLHVDVMDGHFVPNITLGPPIVESLRKVTKMKLDVHLMITNPDKYAPEFIQAGADQISVHQEACPHLDRTLNMIRAEGAVPGVVLNPGTPVATLDEVLGVADFVLLMSVNPGFGGQKFIPNTLKKIRQLTAKKKELGLHFPIEIDGGIGLENVESVIEAGIEWVVAGSSVFHTVNPPASFLEMQKLARGAARRSSLTSRLATRFSMFGYTNRFMICVSVAVVLLASSCGFKRKKYENPITKDTQQPDKVLFDKAIKDIEHGRFEVARLTLNTLINTYDTSEFLAKAKLAIADSWFREGGLHGMAQAEAEYKDFILFYPTMEEAAESQERICDIHYRQMQKPDRDPNDALRAEQECKQLMVQFPNSKFAPQASQRLRDIQEVLGESEMLVGDFYHHKGSWAAAANRLTGLSDQYPLYSRTDEALWEEGDAYGHMGARFRPKAGEAYTRLVRDYPLSSYADQAKKKLRDMELPVPEADPAAVARMKYEAENRTKPGMFSRSTAFLRPSPDVSSAAKSGTPQMSNPKQQIPVSVPPTATEGGVNDVTVSPVTGTSALDTQPDARSQAVDGSAKPADATPAATPDNGKKKKNNKKNSKQAAPAQPAPAATGPAN